MMFYPQLNQTYTLSISESLRPINQNVVCYQSMSFQVVIYLIRLFSHQLKPLE